MAPEEPSSVASAAAPAAATRQWGLRGSARMSPAPVARGNASGGAGTSPPQPRSSGGGGGGRGRWTWWPLLATALIAVVLLQARATAALWRRSGELAALREEVAAAVLAALLARSAAGQVAAGAGAAGDPRPLPAGWQGGGGWGAGGQQAPRHLVKAFCGSPSAAAAVSATAASLASATASARGAAVAASAPAAAAAPPGRAPDLLASLQKLCSAAGLFSTPASAASAGGNGGASGPGLLNAAGEVLLAALLAAGTQAGRGAANAGASTALTGTLLGPPRGDIEVAEAAGAAAAGGRRMGRGRNGPNNAALGGGGRGDGSSGGESGSGDGGGGSGPTILVGVFTGPNPGGRPTPDPRHDSALRRAAIRGSWLSRHTQSNPANGAPAAAPRAAGATAGAGGVGSLAARAGGEVVVRFVVGEVVNDTAAAEALAAEAEQYGDFMRLPGVQECYTCLPHKTRDFFAAAVSAFPSVRFVVKADDDVYLLPHRLPAAAQQWERMGADYIGCMTHGPVRSDPQDRWFEPQNLLLGPVYFLHAYGSAYVLSARAVRDVVVARFEHLRLLANEDTSVGAWVLGADVAHFEDMRLCAPGCHPAALALAPVGCAGLCDPVADMAAAAANASCTSDAPVPLPYMPSYPEHVAFERMWV